MVDQEVEDILKQIRDSVRAEEPRMPASLSQGHDQNSESASTESWPEPSTHGYPNLATMNRAWDRLPPVMSNRRGALASLELWLKRILKRGSRWFTWEQVNFNAAVHQTFREVIGTLTTHEQQVAGLKAQIDGLLLQLQQEQGNLRQLTKVTAELSKAVAELRSDQERTSAKTRLAALEVQCDVLGDERKELQARVNESLLELRESAERILDEQRVSFKQIALETGEALAHDERERRALAKRIETLENGRESVSKATGGND